ncbi:MAG TPA: hypothetical protein PLF79_16750 [Thauera sp.]|uniref:hypothetical protein n=1 Tax=Thauera sp. TaxID=1905334 RepID=UPI002BCF4AAB|nr:hypothetical protein [Thauera sp.]HRP26113.1 hypothetical protein [Thauera sp.]HRP67727.1 hypothetical protein [Thauera sp.]
MNKQPLEAARDTDLRLSAQAMQRAALRARELAEQTGTAIVISRDGVLEEIRIEKSASIPPAHEPSARCGGGTRGT